MTRRHIVDTTLRDGEQCPGLAMDTVTKLRLMALLEDLGVAQIEAGTPALGECEAATLKALIRARRRARIATWNRMLEADLQASFRLGPDVIHISAPVSPLMMQKKLGRDPAWVKARLLDAVDWVRGRGYEVSIGLEDASRADPDFLSNLLRSVRGLGVARARYADTVGLLAPHEVKDRVRRLIRRGAPPLQMHAHNDLGMAVANTLAAASAGAAYLDVSFLGLGERAGGCCFHHLALAARGRFDLGAGYGAVLEASREAARILGLPQPEE